MCVLPRNEPQSFPPVLSSGLSSGLSSFGLSSRAFLSDIFFSGYIFGFGVLSHLAVLGVLSPLAVLGVFSPLASLDVRGEVLVISLDACVFVCRWVAGSEDPVEGPRRL